MDRLHAVIMAGGAGTRFWPASRKARPKHFLRLLRDRSLIAAAVDRARALLGPERVWIATNAAQASALPSLLDGFPGDQIIVEPSPRDTAACVALATAWIESRDPGAVIAVMPADHVIEPQDRFHDLLRRAVALARDDRTLVTFGVTPHQPSTAYGYIERGAPLAPGAFSVSSFREKPDLETARAFLETGAFLWNSGIFVWTARAILAAMDAGNPELARGTRKMLEAIRAGDEASLAEAFSRTPRTSIDYAVMEKAPHVAVLEAELRWDDLGSFLALGSVAPTDAAGNIALLAGGAELIQKGSSNCIVYGEGARTVALFGTSDLVVVAVDDAVLVCPKNRAEELKTLIDHIRSSGREDLL